LGSKLSFLSSGLTIAYFYEVGNFNWLNDALHIPAMTVQGKNISGTLDEPRCGCMSGSSRHGSVGDLDKMTATSSVVVSWSMSQYSMVGGDATRAAQMVSILDAK